MAREVEGIGKNYDEAVEDGLKKIGLTKEYVEIQLMEEPKKRLFSILDPKQVKVKLIEKEGVVETKPKDTIVLSEEDKERITQKAREFLNEYFEKLGLKLNLKMEYRESSLYVEIDGEKAGLIIGYRGETLDALQTMLSAVINKKEEGHVRVVVDAENYREKRVKTLEELAMKVASTVTTKKKSITLEPMAAFERRIIHSTLQNHPKVKSSSIGEEPYRKVVISLK